MLEQHAIAVLTGAAHIVREATPPMMAIAGRPMIGIPLREAFPEPVYLGLFELLDWVRRFRKEIRVVTPAAVTGAPGVATVTPVTAEDVIVIVWHRVPAHARAPRAPRAWRLLQGRGPAVA